MTYFLDNFDKPLDPVTWRVVEKKRGCVRNPYTKETKLEHFLKTVFTKETPKRGRVLNPYK